MCIKHHSLYDSRTSQHKNYTITELKQIRTLLYDAIKSGQHLNAYNSNGGKGGSASVIGNYGTAVGGKGGNGGPGGKGGDGGSVAVVGVHGVALGGNGGEAGQVDRGGRGGSLPLENLKAMGLNDPIIDFVSLYLILQKEYETTFNCQSRNTLPEEWVNMRLRELGSPWYIQNTNNGYTLHRRAID